MPVLTLWGTLWTVPFLWSTWCAWRLSLTIHVGLSWFCVDVFNLYQPSWALVFFPALCCHEQHPRALCDAHGESVLVGLCLRAELPGPGAGTSWHCAVVLRKEVPVYLCAPPPCVLVCLLFLLLSSQEIDFIGERWK